MRKENVRIMLFVLMFLITLSVHAFASSVEKISISTLEELVNNSTTDQSKNAYVLIPGDIQELKVYEIIGVIDISSQKDFNSISLNDNNLQLNVQNSNFEYVLKADKFIFGDNGGILELRGGKGIASNAVNSAAKFNSIIQNRGKLNIYGGSGQNSYGLIVNYIEQNRGAINVLGGLGKGAYGMEVDTIDQYTTSMITSMGNSSSDNSPGIVVKTINQYDNAIINTTGGGGLSEDTKSYGILANSVNQYGSSTLKANGGSGGASYGLQASNIIQNNSSVINAKGGILQNKNSHGIEVNVLTQNNSSTINATGNIGGFGLKATAITQNNSSSIYAYGSVEDPDSIVVGLFGAKVDSLVQNDSSLAFGTGGGGTEAHGLYVSSLTQNGGSTVTGQGSTTGNGSYGVYIESLVQTSSNAVLNAIGGSRTTNYGIYIDGDTTISGTLNINRHGASSSLYVKEDLTMEANSRITVNINLAKEENLAAGLISANSMIFIDQVRLNPSISNTYILEQVNDSVTAKFVEVRAGNVDSAGDFTLSAGDFTLSAGTITLSYSHGYESNGYYLTVKRAKTPEEAFNEAKNSGVNITENQLAFVTNVFDLATSDAHSFTGVLNNIDNQTTIDNALNYVNRFLSSFALQTLPLWQEIGMREMTASQISLDNKIKNYSVYQTNQIWISPIYTFGQYLSEGVEFREFVESAYGVTLGGMYKLNNVTLAAEGHFIKTTLTANENGSSAIGYGAAIALDYKFANQGKVNPNIRFSAGYKYRDIDIEVANVTGNREAETKENTYMIGLAVGHDFKFFNRFGLDVQIGANYINMKFDAYDEGSNFTVDVNDIKSLEGNVRLGANFAITDSLNLSGQGTVSYEFLNPELSGYSTIGTYEALEIAQVLRSYDKLSLNLGAGLSWQATSYLNINCGYDFYKRGLYTNNQVKIDFKVQF